MKLLGKILGAPNALLRSIACKLIVERLQKAATGAYGETWQRVYVALEGRKTLLAVAVGAIAFALEFAGFSGARYVGYAAGVFALTFGLPDKAVRTPGRPDALASSWLYRFAADNAGTIGTMIVSGAVYVSGPACEAFVVWRVTITCGFQWYALLTVAGALYYLGILDTALLAKVPRPKGLGSTFGSGTRG